MSRMTQVSPGEARHDEPHGGGMATRLNWLRAAVLGANDGIVSTAGLVVGVAGASSSRTAVLTAGLAGLFAGALAIASGEYVSVAAGDHTRSGSGPRDRHGRRGAGCTGGDRGGGPEGFSGQLALIIRKPTLRKVSDVARQTRARHRARLQAARRGLWEG